VSAPLVEQNWLRRSPGLILCLLLAGLAAIMFGSRLYAARSALARKNSMVRHLSESIAARTARDPLTGLLDRYAFQHRLQQSIDERRQGALGVVTLDLNRFREVNESLGHAAGDTILRDLAERLTQRFGSGGFIARLGGDQIALCVSLPARENVIGTLCGDLDDTIAQALTISGMSLTLTASGRDGRDRRAADAHGLRCFPGLLPCAADAARGARGEMARARRCAVRRSKAA
jgi:diguanylate cyclase (GGDEF)-like protein